jgi:hypothetical protein
MMSVLGREKLIRASEEAATMVGRIMLPEINSEFKENRRFNS